MRAASLPDLARMADKLDLTSESLKAARLHIAADQRSFQRTYTKV
jgi:hypothetical protein